MQFTNETKAEIRTLMLKEFEGAIEKAIQAAERETKTPVCMHAKVELHLGYLTTLPEADRPEKPLACYIPFKDDYTGETLYRRANPEEITATDSEVGINGTRLVYDP